MSDVRVAPNIYRTPRGWRVYVRRKNVLHPKRFPASFTLEQLQAYVDDYRAESARLQEQRREEQKAHAGSFAADAKTYLVLRAVKAMPSYTDRTREIDRWTKAFGRRPRSTITARDIDEQLQAWRDEGLAAASVNKLRTALMSLYTRLDGRGGANPVRETHVFEEPAPEARGRSYEVIRALLDAMPADQSRPVKGEEGSRSRGSLTRVRFEIMAWTGMTPSQIKQLRPRHLNLKERWYISPGRRKGHRRPRHPRPEVKKPMTRDAFQAFKRFVALKAWGPFNTRSLRHSLERARVKAEKALQEKHKNPRLEIPRLRPYDFRHSFATELFRRTGNLPLVAEMLDHSSLQMTKRYALGGVSDVMRSGMRAFEAATARPREGNAFAALPPRPRTATPVHRRRKDVSRATPKRARKRPKHAKR